MLGQEITVASFIIILISLYCTFLLLVFVIVRMAALLSEVQIQRRWKSKQSIIAEYEAPLNLSPSELGFLFDRAFTGNELLAVVFQLIQKGSVTISSLNNNYVLHARDTPHPKLSEAELTVLSYLKTVPSDINWNDMTSYLSQTMGVQADCESAVLGMLAGKNLYTAEGILKTAFLQKTTGLILSFLLTLITVFLPIYLIYRATHATGLDNGFQAVDQLVTNMLALPAFILAWWALYFYSNFVAYIYFRAAGLPIGATAELRTLWPQIVGYREYLVTVEFTRLDTTADIQNPALPYCVALGYKPDLFKFLA